MARRGRSSDEVERSPPPAGDALNTPFRALRQHWKPRPVAPPVPAHTPKPAPPPIEPPDDADLFASAVADVVPLAPHDRVEGPPPGDGYGRPVSEEAEALAALSDLVTGVARFDITDTREYVEGAVVGLDARILRRLRRGDYSWQAHVDLHGFTTTEAREVVERFVAESYRAAHRCLLIVHGRGLNSKDQTPVLKERLKSWLARGRIGKVVLAFATARPCDGGAGALYVLLRRDRRARPISVIEGAKR